MPLDKGFESIQRRTYWSLRFSWLPRRCILSKKIIWLQRAYRGDSIIKYEPDMPPISFWVRRDEYLMAILKGKVPI